MTIVCPNCETSYDIAPETLGPAGRTVRCVRCRQTWHARIDDGMRIEAMAAADGFRSVGGSPADAISFRTGAADEAPVPRIDSPPIADTGTTEHNWTVLAHQDAAVRPRPPRAGGWTLRRFTFGSRQAGRFRITPPMAVGAMAALAVALLIWRKDVVRLMPQTAAFFQSIGLGVNLRDLAFQDVRVMAEMVNGSRVFVIEGEIAATARKPVELPRLRFVVQDERGADIYAWNTVLEQTVLQPGERLAFRSRLASPPADARNIVVRFFNKRDIASGRA
ncbi:zinc finger/thioredoxin [Afipia sp. P52-10]|uniref:MJ0042-type zinc finger domain-containing protein n=1 Tax=Afipia sp. P52-10 TaxID=1429916 RepID=UPI0003DF1D01|nr:MJ0042-type zinc finger domain-containing protein [Afipia sp. P52-10]ETR77082.1 zinc finger/thioredoxin [Afipia sp. P52-10]